MASDVAIEVEDLRKDYGSQHAVRGISFCVRRGEVFGLLGPNGAGKTTTVEILEGYRERTAGHVAVLGMDPGPRPLALRERIGIVLQHSELWQNLTVRETLGMFAGYYERPRAVEDVIELVGLEDKRDERVKTLSGGQKRRIDLGLALVGDPELVFLDEPTTGFDPEARRAAWDMIRTLRQLGKTILLTTHYLDEAANLSDRVAVLVGGEIVRLGTPGDLVGAARGAEVRWRDADGEHVVQTDEPTKLVHDVTGRALAVGREVEGLEVRRASLEDVYLDLVREPRS